MMVWNGDELKVWKEKTSAGVESVVCNKKFHTDSDFQALKLLVFRMQHVRVYNL